MAKAPEPDAPVPVEPPAEVTSPRAKPKSSKVKATKPVALQDEPTVALEKPKQKVKPRYDYEVVMRLGAVAYGPYSPPGGAVDESEAKQRVLDDNPTLKAHLSKSRWVAKRGKRIAGDEQSN